MQKSYLPVYYPDFIFNVYIWFVLRFKEFRKDCKLRAIKLSRSKFAVVSLEDYEVVSRYRWSVKIANRNSYAFRIENGKAVYMHNQILPPPAGFIVDHENHNGLDNARYNLRLATVSQNGANRRKPSGCRSKYKGVHRKDGKWVARIGYKGKRIYLGAFDDEADAAKAYDEAALKLHGKFAMLNFP